MRKRNLLMIAVTLLDLAAAAYFWPATKRHLSAFTEDYLIVSPHRK